MAKKIIQAQMQQRRDTAAQWAAKNPVLLDGELGVVTDNPNSYKMGDGVTAWNDLPLRGFDGNIVQELGDSATSVMSQKAITEQVAEQNAKLAQLDQEWQSIKDANFNVIVNPHVEVVDMGTATAATIEPDKLYIFGEVATLAIGVVAPAAGLAGNYNFIFQSPADAPTTLSLPLDVKFPKESDSMLSIKENTIYQISILNNLAIATSWAV